MSQKNKRRILLKLSGEILSGNHVYGIDPQIAQQLAKEVAALKKLDIDIGIVLGAGNIFRGRDASEKGMDRVTADYIGMVGTVINSVTLQDSLEQLGLETRTLSGIDIPKIAEPYIRRRALRHLEKGRIVIIAGGTGNPFFTTDTAACLRGIEIDADLILKATKVDGVYSSDPELDSNAVKYDNLTYDEIIEKKLGVMDLTAICLSRDHQVPIKVFNMNTPGALLNNVMGEPDGTHIA
jgi:uridylate kinase